MFTPQQRPWRRPVYLGDDGASITVDAFQQQFGHYTSPVLPLHDAQTGAMYTVFFGGMNEFYLDEATGQVVHDVNVPFTDDVTALVQPAGGPLAEAVLPVRMPGLLGTNAAFFEAEGAPRTANGVVRLREMTGRTLAGHIVGGITTEELHPWLYRRPSRASERVFAVYVTPNFAVGAEPGAPEAPAAFAVGAPAPNPFRDAARLPVALDAPQALTVEAFDALGRRVATLHDGPLPAGRHAFTLEAGALPPGLYVLRVTGATGRAARRVLLTR